MRFRKPLETLIKESQETGEHSLKRSLGSINLVALGIGAIIGAGLFSLTGIAAADNAGAAVTLSFVIAAVGCAFAGLCYAEFASMIPVAGSAYTYSYATMGELVAWIIGWDLVLEYALGAATVSVSWSSYLSKFLGNFGISLPYELTHAPMDSMTLADGSVVSGFINLPAIFIVFALSMLLIKGTKESAFLNGLLVALKVTVVLVFIAIGWHFINPANHTPFIPENTGVWGEYGWSGVFRGAAVVFFAYIGFDAVSTAAQESKNPRVGMPIGILGSLVISTILYLLFSYVMTGMANYTEFKGSAAPVAVAIAKTPYAWLQQFIILAILAGYTSVILVMLLGQSRIFYSMSKDGLLPSIFSKIHPKFKTPYKNNLLFAIFTSLLAGFVNISDLGHMVSIGTLFAFVLVAIGVMIMRKTQPDAPRAFKTPLVPLVPILGIVVCLAMMLSLPIVTWIRLFIWMAIGFTIYFTYGKNHSLIRNAKNFSEK
ncbi:amino acid permease [Alistipes sp. ZOR0009]|jgi:APA family basic amino acid/polyamine antiporter|uniref:amino acid permease n=1 Tax=Alistipes sp. ZOR0009 TaxID=1339253 RepID=UPI0006467932|nr:amino acid permease [Alistipes sp. ZOR0009]